MTNTILINIIRAIYQKNNGIAPDTKSLESIVEIVESNGLVTSDKIPSWFLDLWNSILKQQATEKRYFLMSEIIDSDDVYIANFLAEISEILNIDYENYGEGITMKFIHLGIDIFICMEGGNGGCFYQIQAINSINS